MRYLFRRASSLLRQYPILWLPVATADLIKSCIALFQMYITATIARNLTMAPSVLSNSREHIQKLSAIWTIGFASSKFVAELCGLCAYTAALIATSVLVSTVAGQSGSPWPNVAAAINSRRFSIFSFCLKLFVLLASSTFLLIWIITHTPLSPTVSPQVYGVAIEGLFFAAVGWVAAPSAMELMRERESARLNKSFTLKARNFTAIAVLASTLVYYLLTKIEPSFIYPAATVFDTQIFWIIGSAISATPYVLLFIALSLLATIDDKPPQSN